MEHTIEEYLAVLVDSGAMDVADSVILNSISRQVKRNIGLTDRQHLLVKNKLVKYKNFFETKNMNHLDLALDNLKIPLRSIDRSQTITVEDGWMVIRFPFNKKTIAQLDTVSGKYRQFYQHAKNSNEHKFKLYEPVINEIIELFKNKSFLIDPQLLEFNREIEEIKSQELSFVPKVTEQGLFNLPNTALEALQKEVGEFSDHNMFKYWDRSIRYGYKKSEKTFDNASELTNYIANRNSNKIYLDPSVHTINDVAATIKDLDRFPLLVILSRQKELSELKLLVETFNFVDTQQQTVLDRIEDSSDPNFELNQYIKDKNFNTWLDNNTKIVYIFKNRLPKLLLRGEWRPTACLSLTGERETTNTSYYLAENCDLNIVLDKQHSHWDDAISRQLTQWV
jgi:hypothetical protein